MSGKPGRTHRTHKAFHDPAELTPREVALLRLVAEGLRMEAVAAYYFLTLTSARRALRDAFDKIGAPKQIVFDRQQWVMKWWVANDDK